MKPLLFLLFSVFLTGSLFSQTLISGTMRDSKNHPVAGASLSIKDSYDGATTDSSGNFSFSTSEKGPQTLVATSIGFKEWEQPVTLEGKAIKLDILLKQDVSELKAVIITAGSFEAGDRKRGTVLSSLDIATTASANADVTGAIKTLPGTQQVGESSGLFVRGGTAAETKTYIDGTLVNNFFYSSAPNIASRGRFSPFIFKGTIFSAGGYSALYGQALSSALILESTDLAEKTSASLGISPISLSGGYEYLAKNKKWSWGASYSYTNVKLAFMALKTVPDYFVTPSFHNADANFRVKTSKTGILKYYGYFSSSKVGVRNPSIDTLNYKDAYRIDNLNMYHNLSWKESFGNQWKLNAGLSYSNNKDDIDGSLQDYSNEKVELGGLEYKNFGVIARGNYLNAKAVLEKRLNGLSALRFGGEYNYSNDHSIFTPYNSNPIPVTIKDHLEAAFVETDLYVTNNLAAKIGTRLEHSSLLNKANIAPRVSVAYKVSDQGQASLAYGIFYQNPENKYLPSPNSLTFTKATHYIAQYQKMADQTILRLEAYYKKYDDLLKTVTQYNSQEIGVNNHGYGDAKGFELFWRDKKNIKNIDYWISYSYLDTKRDFLNYPYAIEPNFASKHTASLVVKKFATGLKTMFNASYTYASPRPYYNIRYDNAGSKFAIYDQGKTISYNSLSLSIDYLPNVFKKGAKQSTVFVFSVTNVLGNKQVYGYQYSYNGYRKDAILPPTKTFVFIGAFFSFGVDRSEDVINSNL